MLDLDLSVPGTAESHPADIFVDGGLNRHRFGWDAVGMRSDLQMIADRIWQACCCLAVDNTNPDAVSELGAAERDYETLYRAAQQLARDHTTAQVAAAKRAARKEARRASAVRQSPTAKPSRRSDSQQRLAGKLWRRLNRFRHWHGKIQ